MKFLFPTFLFALSAVLIPVFIHLFSFRVSKTVYFSNVGFLKNVKKESKKQSRLKQLLLLIARVLTIIFLVFAFAQPYIPVNRETQLQSSEIVGIYVDNSFSMSALADQGQLLELARKKALEICLAYPASTRFRLFTNDMDPKHSNELNRQQFIQQVSEIQSSPITLPLSTVFNRFTLHSTEETNNAANSLYILSDFQQSISDLENFENRGIFTYFLPLVPNQLANLFIDSCWVEVPAHRLNQEEKIYVRIKNDSEQDFQNLPLKLFLNDSIKSITNFNVNSGEDIISELIYKNNSSGLQLGRIEITDYPFTHDNNWFLSYYVEPQLKALAINGNNRFDESGMNYINALFEEDNYIHLDQVHVRNLQTSKLNEYNTVFLIHPENFSTGFLNELEKAVASGLSVVLFPTIDNDLSDYNTFLSVFGAARITGRDTTIQRISGIDFGNDFFTGVFRKQEENAIQPEINGHFVFETKVRSAEKTLLWFQNNDKALSSVNFGEGKVWIFAFPLDVQNESFTRDVLFVPSIYNIILNSTRGQKMALTIGEDNFYTIPGGSNDNTRSIIEVAGSANNDRFVPAKTISTDGTRVNFANQIRDAGHYFITSENDTISAVAMNYNRTESDLNYYSSAGLEDYINSQLLKNAMVISDIDKDFSQTLKEIQQGKQLWRLFILLALIFIVLEILIARFMK